jgi:hypothetical protein
MIARLMTGVATIALCAGVAAAADKDRRGNGDPGRMICRTVAETGSRLSKTRTCRTAEEWAEQRRQTREAVERFQDTKPQENPS